VEGVYERYENGGNANGYVDNYSIEIGKVPGRYFSATTDLRGQHSKKNVTGKRLLEFAFLHKNISVLYLISEIIDIYQHIVAVREKTAQLQRCLCVIIA